MVTHGDHQEPGRREASLPGVRGAWLTLARLAWAFFALLVAGLYIAALPIAYRQMGACYEAWCMGRVRTIERAGISLADYAAFQLAIGTIIVMACLALAALLAFRASGRIALYAAFALVLFGVSLNGMFYELGRQETLAGALAGLIDSFNFLFFVLFYVFPDGRFVPRWTRWSACLVIVIALASAIAPRSVGLDLAPLFPFAFIFLMSSAAVAQVYRYRRVSDAIQRQQTKVVVACMTVLLVLYAIFAVSWLFPMFEPVPESRPGALAYVVLDGLLDLAPFLVPLSFAVAILRYRLWDLDLIINRALVYGTLTLALGLVYVGGVVALQFAIGGRMGGSSQFPVVASTLGTAALARPLRARVQRATDRRFYRRKYDAARVIASFGTTLRDETDLDRLGTDLVAAAEETMQPAHISLWLRPSGKQD